jgi:hypothetical protein
VESRRPGRKRRSEGCRRNLIHRTAAPTAEPEGESVGRQIQNQGIGRHEKEKIDPGARRGLGFPEGPPHPVYPSLRVGEEIAGRKDDPGDENLEGQAPSTVSQAQNGEDEKGGCEDVEE